MAIHLDPLGIPSPIAIFANSLPNTTTTHEKFSSHIADFGDTQPGTMPWRRPRFILPRWGVSQQRGVPESDGIIAAAYIRGGGRHGERRCALASLLRWCGGVGLEAEAIDAGVSALRLRQACSMAAAYLLVASELDNKS